MIKQMWIFKSALFSFQLTARLLCQQFVVIETAKRGEEIFIQRSKNFSDDENIGTRKYGVRDSVEGNPRIKPLCRSSSDFGFGSMKDLIQFLFEKMK